MLLMGKEMLRELQAGLKAMNVFFPEEAFAKLLQYLQLLKKWNQAYSLISLGQSQELISRHVLDSLSIAPFLTGEKILDVGSGAGFPAIPLALYYPSKTFVLIDSQEKKNHFLFQVKAALDLDNVTLVKQRVETYHAPECFDHITVRAFGSLKEIVEKAQHLCCNNGQILAMKGKNPVDEIKEIKHDDYSIDTVSLTIPNLHAERHLVIITKKEKRHGESDSD